MGDYLLLFGIGGESGNGEKEKKSRQFLVVLNYQQCLHCENCSPMLCLRPPLPLISTRFEVIKFSKNTSSLAVCALKGPRPRSPRVWKTKQRIGTISKSAKLVDCIKGLSNVKEEVYGALDSFIAWELEFPLIAVKKALKTLENEQEWKRIIQVIKWMLSKGQGRTMGTYFTLLNALNEDERLDEAEELWSKLFSDNLEGTPRIFFDKMISIYYKRGMHQKMFEIFADMEELGVQPNVSIVNMMGNVFQKLGMLDKYHKLKKKYPPPKWEYRYIKGKRVRVRAKHVNEFDGANESTNKNKITPNVSKELDEEDNTKLNEANFVEVSNELDEEAKTKSSEADVEVSCLNESNVEEVLTELDNEEAKIKLSKIDVC